MPLSGREVPEPRPLVAFPLVLECEPLVAGHGRPALGFERHPLVDLLADGVAGARVDHAERRMDEVAVLGVLEAEQRAVRGERAAEESAVSTPPSWTDSAER